MRCLRHKKCAAALGMIWLASIASQFMAGPIPPFASIAAAQDGKATPTVLSLQKQLVEELAVQMKEMRAEERIGQRRSIHEVIYASEVYFRELETLEIMEARSSKDSISEGDLLTKRIQVRSMASSHFKEYSRWQEDRFRMGEIVRTDLATAKAAALKAEVMLEALKSAK